MKEFNFNEALEAEIESHLSYELRNRKNDKSSKQMRSSVGEFELNVSRDRNGTFEPKIVKKYQTLMSEVIKEKILSPYSYYSQIAQLLTTGIDRASVDALKRLSQRKEFA
jgi:transposase-like protein